MHWLVVGCLILSTILVACGGDTEDVTEVVALHTRLTAIEATLASSGEAPAVTPPLTSTLPPTPTPATAQTAGPDAIRDRQAELRAAEADAEASLVAAAADIATRWAERQLLFDSCMVTELEETEYAELLGFDMGPSEWTNFVAIAIEGPLSYMQQGMLADHSWWRQAAGIATATPPPAPAFMPASTQASTPTAAPAPTVAPTPAATAETTAAPVATPTATEVPAVAAALLGEAERRRAEAMAASILAEMRLMLLCWYLAKADL